MKSNKKSTYSLPIRMLALVMTILVASGILVYGIMFFMNLFH